jgi:hypothetical protein
MLMHSLHAQAVCTCIMRSLLCYTAHSGRTSMLAVKWSCKGFASMELSLARSQTWFDQGATWLTGCGKQCPCYSRSMLFSVFS